jgi:hypothetical protein
VEWIGGYTLPVDNTEHTAVTAGTLPEPITLATINITRDYLTLQTVNGGIINKEQLGDYNYTLSNISPKELNDIVDRQNGLLYRYKRFGWI